MSDTMISLPGSETFTLTGQTIDKLIRAGDGDAALLYLYILKTRGQSTSSEAAIALDKGKGWVASAMAVLSRLGLVHLDDSPEEETHPGGAALNATSRSAPHPPSGAGTGAQQVTTPGYPPDQPRQYTQEEVTREILTGTDFSIVVDETQRRLGKHLSGDELLRLFGIYDSLRLPP